LSEGRVKAQEEAHRDLEILGASEYCKSRFGIEHYREKEAQVDKEASKSHSSEFIDHLKLILNIPSYEHSPEEQNVQYCLLGNERDYILSRSIAIIGLIFSALGHGEERKHYN